MEKKAQVTPTWLFLGHFLATPSVQFGVARPRSGAVVVRTATGTQLGGNPQTALTAARFSPKERRASFWPEETDSISTGLVCTTATGSSESRHGQREPRSQSLTPTGVLPMDSGAGLDAPGNFPNCQHFSEAPSLIGKPGEVAAWTWHPITHIRLLSIHRDEYAPQGHSIRRG